MEPCSLGVAWPSSACTTWALVKDTGPGPQPTPLDPNLQIHTRPTAATGRECCPWWWDIRRALTPGTQMTVCGGPKSDSSEGLFKIQISGSHLRPTETNQWLRAARCPLWLENH